MSRRDESADSPRSPDGDGRPTGHVRRRLVATVAAVLFIGALAPASAKPQSPERSSERAVPDACAPSGVEDAKGDEVARRVERLHRDGRWRDALALARELVRRRVETVGPCEPRTGAAHADLGALLLQQGDPVEAEIELGRALEILEPCASCTSELAIALDHLAQSRAARGDYADEARLRARALALLEPVAPEARSTLAALLRQDALAKGRASQWKEAERQVRRALVLHEQSGEKLEQAKDHLVLGALLRNQGKVGYALEALTKARDIESGLLGPMHPELGRLHRVIGEHYQRSNMPAEAAREYGIAERIMRAALGPHHPWLGDLYGQWGLMAASRGDIETALDKARAASAIEERMLARLFVGSSELDNVQLAHTLRRSLDRTLAMQQALGDRSAEMVVLGLEAVFRTKGRVLDAAAGEIALLRASLAPADRQLVDRLAQIRSELAARSMEGPGATDAASYRAELDRLENEGAELERQVSQQSHRLKSATAPVRLADVQRRLPADSVLVEYVRYTPRSLVAHSARAERIGPDRYFAWIVRPSGPPAFLQLSLDAPTLDRLVEELRRGLQDPSDSRALELASRLWPVVIGRLEPAFHGARHVVVVPDAGLGLLPFAALIDLGGRPLIDRYALSTLTSSRDLLRERSAGQSRTRPIIVASPDYDLGAPAVVERASPSPEPTIAPDSLEGGHGAATDAPGAARDPMEPVAGDSGRSGALVGGRSVHFVPLPATTQEALAIAELLPGASVWRGADATESALKALVGPRILHVATHGFFFAPTEPASSRRPSAGSRDTGAASGAVGRAPGPNVATGSHAAGRSSGRLLTAPLTQSGLALAGANVVAGGEDGVLTALEVAGLDLRGTELVVLSACDTGLGSVRSGEGLLGMQRALVLSGAESAVLSLWKVDDAATRELMSSFYERLISDGLGRAEALRQAQLGIVKTERWRHPAFWASFVLTGAWGPLAGDDEPSALRDGGAGLSTPPDVHPAASGACGCRLGGRSERQGRPLLEAGALFVAAAAIRRRRAGRARGPTRAVPEGEVS